MAFICDYEDDLPTRDKQPAVFTANVLDTENIKVGGGRTRVVLATGFNPVKSACAEHAGNLLIDLASGVAEGEAVEIRLWKERIN